MNLYLFNPKKAKESIRNEKQTGDKKPVYRQITIDEYMRKLNAKYKQLTIDEYLENKL